MNPAEIYIPYSRIKNSVYNSELILEINFEKDITFEPYGDVYSEFGVKISNYSKIKLTEENRIERFGVNFDLVKKYGNVLKLEEDVEIYDHLDILIKNKNCIIQKEVVCIDTEIHCIYSLYIESKSQKLANDIFKNRDYIFFTLERFMEWVKQEEIKNQRFFLKEKIFFSQNLK